MEDTAYEIKLPLFEGPLDLLLHLIRENKIDIYDIPISLITRQYLEYIKLMKELNLEVAGEFLVMAATLIHIKSRMLLPIEETADTDEPEDPRLELVMRLLEYKAFKEAAHGLREREDERTDVFIRKPAPDDGDEGGEEAEELSLFDLNMFDLITAFRKMIERAPDEAQVITRETLTVKDKMSIIIETLQSKDALRFHELFKDDIVKSHYVVTFVALLELIRLGVAKVYQESQFGDIWIINPESDIQKEKLISERLSSDEDGDTAHEPEEEQLEHPYDEPYEFDEGHPYRKSRPFQESRQLEDSHPYGDAVAPGKNAEEKDIPGKDASEDSSDDNEAAESEAPEESEE